MRLFRFKKKNTLIRTTEIVRIMEFAIVIKYGEEYKIILSDSIKSKMNLPLNENRPLYFTSIHQVEIFYDQITKNI